SIRSFLIQVIEVVAVELRIEMPLQSFDRGLSWIARFFPIMNPFPEAEVTHLRLGGPVPDVAARAASDVVHVSFRGVGEFLERAAAIGEWPVFLDEVGGVRAHAPLVAVR